MDDGSPLKPGATVTNVGRGNSLDGDGVDNVAEQWAFGRGVPGCLPRRTTAKALLIASTPKLASAASSAIAQITWISTLTTLFVRYEAELTKSFYTQKPAISSVASFPQNGCKKVPGFHKEEHWSLLLVQPDEITFCRLSLRRLSCALGASRTGTALEVFL